MSDLKSKRCLPCEGKVDPLEHEVIAHHMRSLPGWNLLESGKTIVRRFQFPDYYETIAFVNAIAWLSHHENHHPDLEVGYNLCVVRYTTHAIDGLSENDFICAAKVSALLE